MREVWKFEIAPFDYNSILMPKDSEILTVQTQGESIQIWALCDPNLQKEERIFRIAGTGHPINDNDELHYINTFQLNNGKLIFHVFEVIN